MEGIDMSRKAKTSNEVLTALEYYYDKQDMTTREMPSCFESNHTLH